MTSYSYDVIMDSIPFSLCMDLSKDGSVGSASCPRHVPIARFRYGVETSATIDDAAIDVGTEVLEVGLYWRTY